MTTLKPEHPTLYVTKQSIESLNGRNNVPCFTKDVWETEEVVTYIPASALDALREELAAANAKVAALTQERDALFEDLNGDHGSMARTINARDRRPCARDRASSRY